MSLKFIALSGTIEVTENLYIYEQGNDMLIVDCGVGFPDLEMHGVDLVIPDFSYILKNRQKLRGVILSQGHEDHIGALPFLLRDIKTEIWATPLVTEFLKDKLNDYEVRNVKINTFDPENGEFKVGSFNINSFRVTHSVPDTVGFAIDTEEGRVFHVPEHKMDQNPVDGMAFDIQKAKRLAEGRVTFLASDCLGANKEGFTPSERVIEDNILNIAGSAKQTVFATAISSNIGRFQQMINVAQRTKRKVVFVGRSVQKKTEMAHNLGYLKYPENLVISFKDADKLPREDLMYIVSGCYGQVDSSLYRIALGEHDRVEVESGDTVIFSADPAPPYTKESEDFVIDNLIDRGVDVHYYDLHEGLYVSGHGSQEDIVELFKIVRPKYFIPIGGSIRFMHSYKKLVKRFARDEKSVFALKPGESVVFENGQARRGKTVPTKKVLVHGLGIGDIGKVVLSDRSVLGKEGVVVVVIKVGKNNRLISTPEIISRGFVFERIERDFLRRTEEDLGAQIRKRNLKDKLAIKENAASFLEKHFFKVTGRRPMVLPVVVEV